MTTSSAEHEPFSFQELQDASSLTANLPSPDMVLATDNVGLSIRVYQPSHPPKATLVLYHGGGAHSGAGYSIVGQGLADEYEIAVYTPDLRGHGASGGPRGDAPSAEQVFRDINTVINYVRGREEASSSIPLLLGGHSSGGGLVVNYSSWAGRLETAGYLLLSPQLGYLSNTSRSSNSTQPAFAKVNVMPFIVNGIFGVLGHHRAVHFHYPPQVLADDPGMVSWNTVNMANAITPTAPHDQIREIKQPLGVWVGAEDELFDAEKLVAFVKEVARPAEGTCGVVVPDANHLGMLVHAPRLLGPWIARLVETVKC